MIHIFFQVYASCSHRLTWSCVKRGVWGSERLPFIWETGVIAKVLGNQFMRGWCPLVGRCKGKQCSCVNFLSL